MDAPTISVTFRAYTPGDRGACLALFDANCPTSFAPNERVDYCDFLSSDVGHYEICLSGRAIIGAFGVYPMREQEAALHWILLSPAVQGRGIGALVMQRVFDRMQTLGLTKLHISASHKSAPFFTRFGAAEHTRIVDGWGPDMHRVEMAITNDP